LNGQAFITLTIEKWLALGISPSASRDELREWVLHCIQRRVNHAWLQPWPWTYQEANVAVNTDNSEVGLPSDYNALSKDGHVALEGGGDQLEWMPPSQLSKILRLNTSPLIVAAGTPTHYTEFLSTINDDGRYTGGRRMLVYPKPTVATNVILYYKTKAPTITDAIDTTPASVSNMECIPSEYQESWFMDGVVSDLLDKQGDARAASYEARFLKGMAEAQSSENQGQNSPRRWGRRWGPRWAS
jgi:hypothetical protein